MLSYLEVNENTAYLITPFCQVLWQNIYNLYFKAAIAFKKQGYITSSSYAFSYSNITVFASLQEAIYCYY